jgi:hypothetical protein
MFLIIQLFFIVNYEIITNNKWPVNITEFH